ncbi:hypothetical protein FSP39_019812 [Pinctada imbricata]|uniref:Beta-1,4-glucuronyltransferase 1 n=1 Tax=Pinctada imbricata TaxID=66713 RepID=A0AA88XN54_PINIB|nr:hypothetical protein FSP39_019812 [Pinctada imbricata]
MIGGSCRQGYLDYLIAQRNIQYDKSEAKKDRNRFWILHDFLISENREKYGDGEFEQTLTLVTQTSIEHVHALTMLSNAWDGPISLAVLIYEGQLDYGMKTLLSLFYEFPKIKSNTTLHLVIYKSNSKKESEYSLAYHHGNVYDTSFLNANPGPRLPYPGNLLRNVALSSVQNGFVLMTDIDLVPSLGLHDQFLHFIKNESIGISNKTAYVVPAFEAMNDSMLARDKSQLLVLQEKGYVRPFGNGSCQSCYALTDFKKWSSTQDNNKLSYSIKRRNRKYEPFYILNKNVYPYFDERFKGRHRDRVSQVHSFCVLSRFFFYFPRCISPTSSQMRHYVCDCAYGVLKLTSKKYP